MPTAYILLETTDGQTIVHSVYSDRDYAHKRLMFMQQHASKYTRFRISERKIIGETINVK